LTILLNSIGNLAVLLILLTGLWYVSTRIKDASIIDIAWGPACALPALLTWLRHDGAPLRATLLPFLVALWPTRLAFYLA